MIKASLDELFLKGQLGDVRLGEMCASLLHRYNLTSHFLQRKRPADRVQVGWIDLGNVEIYCAGRSRELKVVQFNLYLIDPPVRNELLVHVEGMEAINAHSSESQIIGGLSKKYTVSEMRRDEDEIVYSVGQFGTLILESSDNGVFLFNKFTIGDRRMLNLI